MVNLAFKSNDLLKETYWYFSMCHRLSKIFFRKKEMAHALQLWETLLAHPTFHYMQLVNTSIPKALLLSLFPPRPSPRHLNFYGLVYPNSCPPPQLQDHHCIEMLYSMAAFISQMLLLKNQMLWKMVREKKKHVN